jgi:predicted O-linked N-acetylglucosamine transferase (SPINDLY family)
MTGGTPTPDDDISLLWRELAQSPTSGGHWRDLARRYAAAGMPWQALYSDRQARRLGAAPAAAVRAGLASIAPEDGPVDDTALGLGALPEAAALEARYAHWLQTHPNDWLTCLYVARLREMHESAAPDEPLARARALEPMPGESLHWMGVWRLNAGDAHGAIAALSGLTEVRPTRCGSMMYLGEALLRVGRIAAAEKAFARASLSNSPGFLILLAGRVYACNYWQEAIAVLRKATSLQHDRVDAWLAMARIQSEVYALDECRESLRRVQDLEPGNAEARLLDAGLQGRYGDARAHLGQLEAMRAAQADPCSRIASSIAMTSLYHDGLTPLDIAQRHRQLCAPIEAANVQRPLPPSAWAPGRRLRIAFVTGDLHRQHPVNLFLLPVIERLDHARFEVGIYHTGSMHDEYTRRARACTDRWLEASPLDDHALRKAIVNDGVDLLIDLAGHTSSHRLGVFALRAAPVQVTFLGYPHSTGLSSMDWIIGDAIVSPIEQAGLFSERIAQMPHAVFCWAPVDTYALPQARPADAPVVFASFNNAMKLSPSTVALWARVLQAVPGAELLLKAPSFSDESVQARYAGLFEAQGIAAERLRFRGPSGLEQMMQEYGDVDVALDPAPYNGGTTTLQALWMGVPVVTLTGGNFVSRMGSSFLATLGRPDWVARDPDAYVAAAARLAGDVQRLRNERPALRACMVASPLCDIDTYVKNLQRLLVLLWQAHRESRPDRVLGMPVEECGAEAPLVAIP